MAHAWASVCFECILWAFTRERELCEFAYEATSNSSLRILFS